ncbi:hypothetical protein [Insolitispirillum peregrinum]|nr:hypothetical protein [Insolitispirillum peregrinum]
MEQNDCGDRKTAKAINFPAMHHCQGPYFLKEEMVSGATGLIGD